MSFDGAAGGHVFGVEVEDNPLAVEAIQGNLGAILRGESERWRALPRRGKGIIRRTGDAKGKRERQNCSKED